MKDIQKLVTLFLCDLYCIVIELKIIVQSSALLIVYV